LANVDIISVLNLLSGIVALATSYYAYKNNKLVGSILLKYISAGFLLLGLGLLVQAGAEHLANQTPLDAVQAVHTRSIEVVSLVLYTIIQVVAYGVFAWGYGLSAFARKQMPQNAPVPGAAATLGGKLLAVAIFALAVYAAGQIAIIVLLLLIVVQGVRVFTHSKSNLALMVLFGFALIFGGHLLMLAGVLSSKGVVFLIGNSIEFLGFLGLLLFLVWSGRVVK
jgi:hypothetical protein